MNFISTQSPIVPVSASEAIKAGLAPDGGLYVPETFPTWDGKASDPFSVLAPFFKNDSLEPELKSICTNAFQFKTPIRKINSELSILELFHGPTAAFKDVGARFLAECHSHLEQSERTVMVATSGDTGGAVAAAYYNRPKVKVIILFPKGMVSARQKKQLTCWEGNISAYEVRGTFDDCQRMVKEAFQNPRFTARGLTSANSINVGRLLPQMTYYAKASIHHFQETGKKPGFIIPSGNMGNAVAAIWAKKSGYPIGRIVMSTNANRAIGDYLDTGVRTTHQTIPTLANAMDVGNPSNLERAIHLYPRLDQLKNEVMAISVSDSQISDTITRWAKKGEIFCPHTATAIHAWEQLLNQNKNNPHWIVASTAHPAKFETVVEPLIGKRVEIPESLNQLLQRPSTYTEIDPVLEQVE
jgi:threonine synthase